MKSLLQLLFLFWLLTFVSACATTQPDTLAMGNPGELVNQLEAGLAAAKSNKVDVLSPGLFNDAQSALMKAKQALEKESKLSTINDYVAQGNASLSKAEEIAQVSRTILGETNKARDKALKVGADRLGEPYIKVEEQYLKLTKAIENDNLSYAQKNASKVQAEFKNVEIMAIKESAIGKARQLIAKAEAAKTPKIAPKAYADAVQAINETDTFIGNNPYDAEMIGQKAAHAEFMARRAIAVSENSKMLSEMAPEASALYIEGLLARLSGTMNAGDLRDQSIDAQVGALNASVERIQQKNKDLEKSNQAYQSRLANMEQQLSGLEGYAREQEARKQELAAEREFNEKFNRVQHHFGPKEAEVYKQGNQLVIRLRAIQFPVGQATLSPDNYNLLSKVQHAIRVFGQPMVTIEGHTDSTGSAQTNKVLSQKRAEAVKTYLVANRTLPENRIRATGYGPDKPLAPNTTAEGRAMNRRIDVLITPFQTQ